MKRIRRIILYRFFLSLLLPAVMVPACSGRRPATVQTAPAVTSEAETAVGSTAGEVRQTESIRVLIPVTDPGMTAASVLLAVPAGQPELPETVTDPKDVQITPRFLALYDSLSSVQSEPYTLPRELIGVKPDGELTGFSRGEAKEMVREAAQSCLLPLQEEPAVMLALDEETLSEMYEHVFGGATGNAVISLTGERQEYRPGQECYYLVWEMQAEGIPILSAAYDMSSSSGIPAVRLPEGTDTLGGVLTATVGRESIVTLGTAGTFFTVSGREEEQPLIPADAAAVSFYERAESDEAGRWEITSMRLAYVPVPESGGAFRLIPCWVCEARRGNYWSVWAIDALTGSRLDEETGADGRTELPEEEREAILVKAREWADAWPYGDVFEVFGVRLAEAGRDTIPYGFEETRLLTVEGSVREAGAPSDAPARLYKWYFAQDGDGVWEMVTPSPEDEAAVLALIKESGLSYGYFSHIYVRLPNDRDSFFPVTEVRRTDHVLYAVGRMHHSAWGQDDWDLWTWTVREKEDGTWEIVDQGY